MTRLRDLAIPVAVVIGVALAIIEARPHFDDTGVLAGLILIASFGLSVLEPRRWYIMAVLLSGPMVVHDVVGGNVDAVLALIFAFLGAALGLGVSKVISANLE